MYEEWIEEDIGGYHTHAAAVTSAGVVSHWGDVGYRNNTKLHALDLDNYQTAPITTTTIYGGYDIDGVDYVTAPQPVSTAPGPDAGSHLASADLTAEFVLSFGNLDSAEDFLEVDGLVQKPLRSVSGQSYDGVDILHLQWVQGVGYISGAVGSKYFHFSPDGEVWAELTPKASGSGRWMIYGSQLVDIGPGGEFYVADIPEVEVVSPLQVAPGGDNRLAASLEVRTEPAAGVTRREVAYDGAVWRYVDDGLALTPQPAPPVFDVATSVYEISTTSSSTDYGSWWLQPEGQTQDAGDRQTVDLWVANLGAQAVQLKAELIAGDLGGDNAVGAVGYESNETTDWTPFGWSGETPADGQSRFALGLRSLRPAPGSRFLVAVRYFGDETTATYPLAPGQSGPDELETVSGIYLDERGSLGLVFQWPENAPQSTSETMPIAAIAGAGGDYIRVSIRHFTNTVAQVVVDYAESGQLVASQVHATNILRGDLVDLVLSFELDELLSTVRVGGDQPSTISTAAAFDVVLTDFAWAAESTGVIAAVDPVLFVSGPEPVTAAEQLEWMKRPLGEKGIFFARPIAGDYNFDGVVDAADGEVWQNAFGSIDFRADANADGEIDSLDYAVWRANYGSAGTGVPGDFNADGVVDAADYAVWRNAGYVEVVPGTGADGDRDGLITPADYDLWLANLGDVDTRLSEVLAAPIASPSDAAAPEDLAPPGVPSNQYGPAAPAGPVIADQVSQPSRPRVIAPRSAEAGPADSPLLPEQVRLPVAREVASSAERDEWIDGRQNRTALAGILSSWDGWRAVWHRVGSAFAEWRWRR